MQIFKSKNLITGYGETLTIDENGDKVIEWSLLDYDQQSEAFMVLLYRIKGVS